MSETTENRMTALETVPLDMEPCDNGPNETSGGAEDLALPADAEEADNGETSDSEATEEKIDTLPPAPQKTEEEIKAEKEKKQAEDEKKRIEDEKKRAEHEAAEAKRKAEWEERQQKKKEAREAKLKEIAALNSSELQITAIDQAGKQMEQFVQRNMKICITEVLQQKCAEDLEFARLVLNPDKNMLHCFKHVNRKAFDYLKKLAEENEKAGFKDTELCGDVPDGLCYQWAIEYFYDLNAEEDKQPEETFVPRPYISTLPKSRKISKKTSSQPAAAATKKSTEKSKKETQPPKEPQQEAQLSFESLSA